MRNPGLLVLAFGLTCESFPEYNNLTLVLEGLVTIEFWLLYYEFNLY